MVSFSPEKRKLLKAIVDSTEEGCEMKKVKLGGSNDFIINQNSYIRKVKPSFAKHSYDVPISTLASVIYELPLYQRVSVAGMIYNISPEMTDEKKGTIFTFKRAMLKDNEESIPIQLIDKTIFNKVQDKTCYRFNHMMINTFEQEKYLKSTKVTTIVDTDVVVDPPTNDHIAEVKLIFKKVVSFCQPDQQNNQ